MADDARSRLAAAPDGVRWALLLATSLAFAVGLSTFHISAALLLGPLAAGVLLAASGAPVSLPPLAFAAAQACVGAMIARVFTPALLHEFVRRWPLFVLAIAAVLAVAAVLGWLLCRWRVLPGTTAAWGTFPGAATVMVLMAGEFGADMRLVAFMQYLRVLIVALVASGIAHVFARDRPAAPVPSLDVPDVVATLGIAAASALAGRRTGVPAGALLGPMVVCAALQDLGWLHVTLPVPLLAAAYAVVGWAIGLRFTRDILRHVARSLPRVLASTIALILGCEIFALLLVQFEGIDPLTAYLAMSPGGADSVAIIAASNPQVDSSFVMALQVTRFLTILLIGPALARAIARHAPPGPAPPAEE